MVIVLVHWRIKPEAVHNFLTHWRRQRIHDRSGLIGEFLSKPLRADALRFRADDLSPKPYEEKYVSFVNVGLWKDLKTFQSQVGKHFNDKKPLKHFERYRRVRVLLKPKSRRIGQHRLPKGDHFFCHPSP